MPTFLVVALLAFVLLDAGCRCARGEGGSRLLAGAIVASSVLLVWLLALGCAGALAQPWISLVAPPFWLGARRFGRRRGLWPVARRALVLARRQPEGGFLLALCALLLGWALWRPIFDVDAASYHLPYTAAALDARALVHVDTPFGDPAAAYQPKNDDLLRVALAPLGDERLAWIGAFPHLPLLLLAIYVAARACGCRRQAALLGAASALVAEFVVRQAATAMVDLPLAAWWCAFAALALRGQALAAGLALGLAYGTKFLAVPFTPLAVPFVALLLLRTAPGGRARALGRFALGACATGAFFYARNAWLTGNPIHPIRFEVGGVTLLDGLYGREQMEAWRFHFTGRIGVELTLWHLLWPQLGFSTLQRFWMLELARALAGALWLGGTLVSLLRPAAAACALLVPAVFATVLFVVPYNDSRFVLLAVAMQGVVVARLAHAAGRALPLLRLAVLFQLGLGHWPTALPPGEQPLVWAVPLAALLALALRQTPWTTAALAAGVLACAAFASRPPALAPGGDDQRAAWNALARAAGRDTVAYAGTNVPYPLRGLERRRVLHVPPDGRPELRFDQHAWAWRKDRLPAPIVPEPNLQRRFQNPAAWLQALRREGVHWLYIAALRDQQLLTVRHDASAWPIEAAWARALPSVFEPVRDTGGVLLFRIHDRDPSEPLPPSVQQIECDAAQLLAKPDLLAQWYPLARAELAEAEYARLLQLANR
jgi:hypothetical protein